MNNNIVLNDIILYIKLINVKTTMGIGDWGLGIGPNPQSPIPNPHYKKLIFNFI